MEENLYCGYSDYLLEESLYLEVHMALWIVPLISVLFVFLSSVLAYSHNRRSLATTVITQQRVEWIDNVRAAVTDFVSTYLKENDKTILWEKKAQIELYLTPEVADSEVINRSHQKVVTALEECIDNSQLCNELKVTHADKVVHETKMMLHIAWVIMKKEAMTNHFEKKRGKAVKELLKKHHPQLYQRETTAP